jgi:hypothetical protein
MRIDNLGVSIFRGVTIAEYTSNSDGMHHDATTRFDPENSPLPNLEKQQQH